MIPLVSFAIAAAALPSLGHARPTPSISSFLSKRWDYARYFDLQAHRGGRGQTIENTLPSFAAGLLEGVTSLELDTGLTKDGHLIIWHDENFVATKCKDTGAVVAGDEMYPYVGKFIANLTLAQIKTLDCGSIRQNDFPLQSLVPGTQLSTLDELFDFVTCATDEPILFNIETKVDGDYRNFTRSPEDFVKEYIRVITARGDAFVDRVTHQSFDWRALIISKQLLPSLRTSALCDDTTLYAPLFLGKLGISLNVPGNLTTHGVGPSNWLAGIDIDSFNGSTIPERVAQAAKSIDADFLSPVATAYASNVTDVNLPGFIPFATRALVDMAHSLDMLVKPWTPNRLNLISYLVDIGVDGFITDYPHAARVWAETERPELKLAPKADRKRVMSCLATHNKLVKSK